MASTAPLLQLADELKLLVIDHIEQDQDHERIILKLSSTCHQFRKLLKPHIYATVYLRNSIKSAKLMQKFLEGDDKIHVKQLHFIGGPPPYYDEKDTETNGETDGTDDGSGAGGFHSEYGTAATILPTRARNILEHLDQFPNLERVVVESREDMEADGFWYTEDFTYGPSEAAPRDGEMPCRALLAKTIDALAENWSNRRIKSLELVNQPAVLVESWGNMDFINLLNSLTEFHFSAFEGEDNQSEAMWTNMYLEWDTFVPAVGEYLLSQLNNVEILTFGGCPKGPIGSRGEIHAPVPMEPEYIPKLRELRLNYIILDPPLIKFIAAHTNTLETLTMMECYAQQRHEGVDGETWAQFFRAIENSAPKKLRKLRIKWLCPVELTPNTDEADGPSSGEEVDVLNVPNTGSDANTFMESIKGPFAYCTIDEDDGRLEDDISQNIQALQKGEDFEAYFCLKKIIDANATAFATRF